MTALFRWYHEHQTSQLRDLVRIVHIALTEACDNASERITPPLVAAAVATL